MILFERPKRSARQLGVVTAGTSNHAVAPVEGYNTSRLQLKNIKNKPELRSTRISSLGNEIIKQLSSASQVSIASQGETLTFGVIARMMRTQVVAFCVGLISSTIRSLPFSVKSEDPLIKQFIDKIMTKHYSEIVDGLVTSFYNGYAFAQKRIDKQRVIFTERDEDGNPEIVFDQTMDVYSKFKFIDPIDSRIYYNYNMKIDEIDSIEQKSGLDTTKVGRNELVWMSYGSPFRKVFGRSKFVDIYTPWELLNVFSRYALEETDRNSSPPIEVSYPDGFTKNRETGELEDNMVVAYDIAKSVVTSVAYAIPSSRDKNNGERVWEVKVLKDWVTTGHDAIKSQIEFANTLIALGLGVPPQLSPFSTKTGASGAGEVEVGLEMLMLSIEPIVDDIQSTIVRDVIDPILRMNFREEGIVPYEFAIDKTVFNRRQLAKEVLINQLQVQGQMLTSGQGIPDEVVDISSLLRHLGIPISKVESAYPELLDLRDDSVDQSNKSSDNPDAQPDTESGSAEDGPLKRKIQNDKDNTVNRKTKRRSRAGAKSGIISGA